MATILDKTKHYQLEVGNNPYDDNQLQYLIRNIETSVIEADSRLLPQAKKYLESLEAYYHAQEDFSFDSTAVEEGEEEFLYDRESYFKKH